ncbi:hypothetical protein WDW86_02390 [Bdellovibrionota bacterium FG-2]
MKKINYLACGASIVSLCLNACSLKSNLDEMHDSTKDMSKTTSEMAKTTTDMARTTDSMAGTTKETLVASKEVARTSEHMDETMTDLAVSTRETVVVSKKIAENAEHTDEVITGVAATTKEDLAVTKEVAKTEEHIAGKIDKVENVTDDHYTDDRQTSSIATRQGCIQAMERSPEMEGKIAQAERYFDAMEFQLVKEEVSQERRQQLYEEGLKEFLLTVVNYADKDFLPNPGSSAQKDMNLNALVVALRQVNPNARNLAMSLGLPEVSILSLIEEALGERREVGARGEVLKREKLAIYLLQSRANFLAAMTLSKVFNITHKGFLGIPGFFTKVGMLLFKWSAKTDGLNVEQLLTYASWLKDSNSTRTFLAGIGEDSRIDSKLAKIYRHMQIDSPPVEPAQTTAPLTVAQTKTRERNSALRGLAEEVNRFRAK